MTASSGADRPVPTIANWSETCDWGHCNGQSYAVRWADDLGQWLAVCRKHRAADVVVFDALPEPNFTDAPASGADQATIRDRYWQCDDTCTVDCGACKGRGRPTRRDQLVASMSSLSGYPPESRTVRAFVAVAEDYADADRERAKAEGGAEALERCLREDHTTVAKLTPIQRLTCVIVKTEDMVMRAAALRSAAGTGEG